MPNAIADGTGFSEKIRKPWVSAGRLGRGKAGGEGRFLRKLFPRWMNVSELAKDGNIRSQEQRTVGRLSTLRLSSHHDKFLFFVFLEQRYVINLITCYLKRLGLIFLSSFIW